MTQVRDGSPPETGSQTGLLSVSRPVAEALAEGRPVVALETSVLAQGLSPPRNLEAARAMESAIRSHGAEPAWVWLRESVRIGASPEDVERLAEPGGAVKAARRDVPALLAGGTLGAATVSATVWGAHAAGIAVMATGGIGGVHPGSGDVSADLLELARTPVVLVCSGPKSILDPEATVERLEELGIGLIGYRCDRLPFFFTTETPIPLEHRADSPEEVAAAARAARDLDIASAVVVCNPVPAKAAMSSEEVADAVGRCRAQAEAAGIRGKALTPYLLSCIADRTDGASVEANLALLESNADLAAQVAAGLVG